MSQKVTVMVWEKPYEISVHQKSKSVWIARGDYEGRSIEVKNGSSTSAASLWANTAKFWGN